MENLALNSQFYESLECPICYDYYTPPIFLCKNGHSVCNQCGAASRCCPLCRVMFGKNSRNLALELILEQITVPCKYDGCSETTTLAKRHLHEQECKFNNTLKCLECNNSYADLLTHLTDSHGYKEILMDAEGGMRSFSGPYESWIVDTVWPRGIWRLKNEPLVVHAMSQNGVFHVYLYKLSTQPIQVSLAVKAGDYTIVHKGPVPSVQSFGKQSQPHFNCDVQVLLLNFLQEHEDDQEILRLWTSVKLK